MSLATSSGDAYLEPDTETLLRQKWEALLRHADSGFPQTIVRMLDDRFGGPSKVMLPSDREIGFAPRH